MEKTNNTDDKKLLNWKPVLKKRRYELKYPFYMHYQLRHLMGFDTFPIFTLIVSSLITLWIQFELKIEPGILFSVAAMNSLFAVLFYGVIYSMLNHGKLLVNYRRDYGKAYRFYRNHMLLSVLGGGVFLGNIFYAVSQRYILEDKQQYILILQDIWHPTVALISLPIALLIIYYTFYQDRYMSSDKYNQMMQNKIKMEEMNEYAAFAQIIRAQDLYHKYSGTAEPEVGDGGGKTGKKIDPYDSVRVKRGGS